MNPNLSLEMLQMMTSGPSPSGTSPAYAAGVSEAS